MTTPIPPRILAHRGDMAHARENTIAAMHLAVKAGADGIEFDVQCTWDGVWGLYHDDTLAAHGDPGAIPDLTEAEIRSRVPADVFPRLTDVLAILPAGVDLWVEVKPWKGVLPSLPSLLDLLRGRSFHFLCFDQAPLLEMMKLSPELDTVWNVFQVTDPDDLRAARQVGIRVVDAEARTLDLEGVEAIRREGLQTSAWNVNDRETARLLTDWGVENLIGNDPAALRTWAQPSSP